MKPVTMMPSPKMKTVKSSCDAAPFGEKKTKAMKHYHTAEAAQTAKDDIKMNRELDLAKHALV
jgi:hypothetical protein